MPCNFSLILRVGGTVKPGEMYLKMVHEATERRSIFFLKKVQGLFDIE